MTHYRSATTRERNDLYEIHAENQRPAHLEILTFALGDENDRWIAEGTYAVPVRGLDEDEADFQDRYAVLIETLRADVAQECMDHRLTCDEIRVDEFGPGTFQAFERKPMSTTTSNCWYATHDGAGYAYSACACNYLGSARCTSYPAPVGMPIAAGDGEVVPPRGTDPTRSYVENYVCPECRARS